MHCDFCVRSRRVLIDASCFAHVYLSCIFHHWTKRSLKAEVCLVSCDHGSEAYIGGFLHFLYQFYSPAVFAISKYLPLAMRLCLDKKDVCPCVWRFPSFFVVPTFKAFQAMMHSAPSRLWCMLCGLTASSNHAQETYDIV